MKYHPDGAPVPAGIPVGMRARDHHYKLFGVYKGIIMRALYPDDPNNHSRDRMEYVVRVGGQEYPNAVNLREAGGIYNYNERIRKGAERDINNTRSTESRSQNLDGEAVYVMFVDGHGDFPVIIGALQHPLQTQYKKFTATSGLFDIEEFNGVEISIDKDSNYLIRHAGRKNPNGEIQNSDAVGAFIKLFGSSGDIEFNTHGTAGTADLRAKFNKSTKKFELYAQENKVVIDSVGITLTDKFGNKVEMKNGGVTITVVGAATINASGDTDINTVNATITASGNAEVNAVDATINASGNIEAVAGGTATVEGSSIILKASSNSLTGGLVPAVMANADPITGILLSPCGGVSAT